jgi:hypothetical protein
MQKVALITGASSGIGLELARECARHGHDLVLVARRADKLQQLADELKGEHGIEVQVLVADLSKLDNCDQIYGQLKETGVEVEYLLNNAGFGDYGSFADGDGERQMQMIQLNIAALTRLTRLYLPDMQARRRGYVLNVASTAAFQPGPMLAVYFASKAYVLHFSEAIANELQGTGVSVTALCPGATASEFAQVANAERSLLFNVRKLPTSATVARYGYRAMIKKRRVAVHGLLNKLLSQSVRLAPRRLTTAIARRMMAD